MCRPTMSEQVYQQLKHQSLSETALYLERTHFPAQPDERYPLFPDAIREVERANPPEVCVICGKPGYFYPADRAYAPGHCYSEAGRKEFQSISSCCEFCFDHLFAEPEEEEQLAKPTAEAP
ncbi:hypothetical protein SEA_ZHENGYI_25 [Microbacterium phage Zhengyi]|nr:hypothetical protein SEA_ZHENGYI_25 [Microbacterium phage Zhengyi]QYC53795.1 hypothetical protein SEA_EUGENEKRABS_25 [Microbacterium phage EugeneKrabs]